MHEVIGWPELLLRLGLAFAAGALIGFNRAERGHAVGLRTALLVCLAAAISMLQVNELLALRGKAADSYVVLDLMRLPLGILSGMGFIGAGAILRRGNLIIGVTTAATLWFATVVGLCFGGGQLGLGSVGVALALIVLWGLKYFEERLPQHRAGRLALTGDSPELDEKFIRSLLDTCHSRLLSCAFSFDKVERRRVFNCSVTWKAAPIANQAPSFVAKFAECPAVKHIEWSPEG